MIFQKVYINISVGSTFWNTTQSNIMVFFAGETKGYFHQAIWAPFNISLQSLSTVSSVCHKPQYGKTSFNGSFLDIFNNSMLQSPQISPSPEDNVFIQILSQNIFRP